MQLGVSALSLSLYPKLMANDQKPIGVALLGLGSYSQYVLAPALQQTQHCQLRGIITGSPSKIKSWQNKYAIADSNVYSYDNMSQIANNSDIDVVYVVTPTSTHLKFCLEAARAGKHVWCEKPMAMTIHECQKIIDECKKNNVKLSIGYRMQHEPNTRTFATYAMSKPYGNMKDISAYAGYGGSAGPKDNWRMQKAMGGGALYDMGVYPINGARFVSDMEPIAVKGQILPHEGFDEVDATTLFTMKFANGIEADCGTSVVKNFNHLKINCEQGWYELKPMQAYSGVQGYTSDQKVLSAFNGNQQAQQMDNDALAIMGKGPILVPGEEGLRDIHIVNKIFESAYSTQDFVDL